MKKLFAFVMGLAIISTLTACTPTTLTIATPEVPQAAPHATGKRPYWPTREWQAAIPAKQDMDNGILNRVTGFVQDSGLDVDSVIVVRHGSIVYEKYFRPPWGKGKIHDIHSCTKSVVGSLVGIAIQQGKIKSLDDKMVDYFPNRTIQNLDGMKRSITLLNLMTMKGGFDWAERTYPYSDPRNPMIQAFRSNDPIQFVLDKPMAAQPGTVWAYNGGLSQILSAIITGTTGLNTLEFAKKNLFNPLGITEYSWQRDRQGIYHGGSGLSLTPRDMAKYGYLILNKGVWEDKQVIPADFVAESVKTHTLFNANFGYGYESWWTIPQDGYYYAAGIRGQRIYVMEKQDMVVVTTGSLPEDSQTEIKMRKIATFAISACN
jgi:CubicO group peptidase (beta-lactamase class C family)